MVGLDEYCVITVDGNSVGVAIRAFGLPSHMPHVQTLFSGPECPVDGSDSNHDGWIDYAEARTSSGAPLLAFTLNNSADFPTPSADGLLNYIGSFPIDAVKGQALDQAVLLLFGIDPGIQLPPSVAHGPGASANSSFPIACGKLVRIEETRVKP